MRVCVGAITAALFFAAPPSVSAAVDATCLWRALPQTARDRALVQAGRDSMTYNVSAEEIRAGVAACSARDPTSARKVVALYGLELAQARNLERRFGVDAARLERLWASMTTAERRLFEDIMEAKVAGRRPNAFRPDRAFSQKVALALFDAERRPDRSQLREALKATFVYLGLRAWRTRAERES